MFSTGNKGPSISIKNVVKISSNIVKFRFWQFWLETFTNCNFNEFFSFVKITST